MARYTKALREVRRWNRAMAVPEQGVNRLFDPRAHMIRPVTSLPTPPHRMHPEHYEAVENERPEVELTARAAGADVIRKSLLYGMWTCADGGQVLFNRHYHPIWWRYPPHPATAADPGEWV